MAQFTVALATTTLVRDFQDREVSAAMLLYAEARGADGGWSIEQRLNYAFDAMLQDVRRIARSQRIYREIGIAASPPSPE